MTIHVTETEEREFLDDMLARIREAAAVLDERIRTAGRDIVLAKQYVWENRDQLDPAERAANVVDISLAIDRGESAVLKRGRLQKLLSSPYFGRVDFQADDQGAGGTYYIGVTAFGEGEGQEYAIYDWRSPVASLFYDYSLGPARYTAPQGQIEGTLELKRQYRIQQGRMEYMIESAMNINDDVLQRELSRTSDEKMKDIAATIQKEQNAIIRNESSRELIIQGAAGSGKTSVALHRIAYLLYRHKASVNSHNILILSPNKVFADYISNVLPELGEEPIAELGMEDIAAAELAGVCEFQTFHEQVAELTESRDPDRIERIRCKAGIEIIHRIDALVEEASGRYFCPVEIRLPNLQISAERIVEVYQSFAGLPLKRRVDKTAASVAANARDNDGGRLKTSDTNKIKAEVKKMLKLPSLLALYQQFYAEAGRPELFKRLKARKLEYSDVFPLLYLKLRLEGAKGYEEIKHLVVDEMQDYTAVQYKVLGELFKCRKTILGDANQPVNPYSSSSIGGIKQVFPGADTVHLLKSYRSTVEIINFAQKIAPDSRIVPIERHGAAPEVLSSADELDEVGRIRELIGDFRTAAGVRTLGIVCKTQTRARALHELLHADDCGVSLLDFDSVKFEEGVMVTTVHMAKGLEFDQVIVPFVNASNYDNEMDRSLLYIACTRAMHKLVLTYHGERSPLIPTC